VPYLSAFRRCVHDEALYKSTFILPYLTSGSKCQSTAGQLYVVRPSRLTYWTKYDDDYDDDDDDD